MCRLWLVSLAIFLVFLSLANGKSSSSKYTKEKNGKGGISKYSKEKISWKEDLDKQLRQRADDGSRKQSGHSRVARLDDVWKKAQKGKYTKEKKGKGSICKYTKEKISLKEELDYPRQRLSAEDGSRKPRGHFRVARPEDSWKKAQKQLSLDDQRDIFEELQDLDQDEITLKRDEITLKKAIHDRGDKNGQATTQKDARSTDQLDLEQKVKIDLIHEDIQRRISNRHNEL